MGLEASGIEVDPSTLDPIKESGLLGLLLPGGGYSEYVKVDRRHIINFPTDFSVDQASAIPEVWLTAYLLIQLSGIKKGEYAYINAGASGVGTALT